MADFIIDDSTPESVHSPAHLGKGAVPRDYTLFPQPMFQQPDQMVLIDESEWDARIEEQERAKSSLEHIRETMKNGSWFPSYDQNGYPYCWSYSTTHTAMFARAVANAPFTDLSAMGMANKITHFNPQGGWCGLSAKFARENGIPTKADWPDATPMSRSHDNPTTWNNALGYRITEDWVDLTKEVYDQNLTFKQVVTCLLLNQPCALDFNWWAHSVMGLRVVKRAGEYCIKILNSWSDNYGDRGMAILAGSKKYPNGAISTRMMTGG